MFCFLSMFHLSHSISIFPHCSEADPESTGGHQPGWDRGKSQIRHCKGVPPQKTWMTSRRCVESGDLKNITCPVYWNSDHICIYTLTFIIYILIVYWNPSHNGHSTIYFTIYYQPIGFQIGYRTHFNHPLPAARLLARPVLCGYWRLLLDGELLRDLTSAGSRWWGGGYKVVPSSLAKLLQITPITMVYGRYIYNIYIYRTTHYGLQTNLQLRGTTL